MKISARLAFTILSPGLLAATARAQVTDPHITTWLTANSAKYARVFETASDRSSGNAVSTWPRSGLTNGGGGQATNAYSDIQRVAYSTNYVYIQTTGFPSYTMGNWLTPNGQTYTSWPTNRAATHRIPRNPSIPATKPKSGGSGGVLVNGVFVWENGDAQSYTTSTGTVSMGGQGIWNRLAGVAEAFNFDPAYGHQPGSGAYHNHINPIGLRYQLGDNVTYNASTKIYSEAGTPTKHSPILGWANDGLPIYGPYGYSTATDATSGIRRMTSGFVKRNAANATTYGTDDLALTGRIKLPVWAASVQGISQTLPATSYGPGTTTTYSVGGGVTGTYSIGLFAEDYEYLGDLGKTQGVNFDLNRQNVRYCVTPEYPGGTYAYFVCIDSAGATVFPDIINQEFFGTPVNGTGTVNSISEAVTEYVDAGPATALVITATAAGSNVALAWNSAEGATYKVESSSDNATFSTLSFTVTSGGLTTAYTAATTANYYRVTLTAIATYDSGGTYGTPIGKTATLLYGTAASAPSITTPPASVTVTAGTSVTFTVAASGTAPLSYQWSKSGAAISGATSASYTIASPTTADAGSYAVTVSNSAGSTTSNAATLTVNSPATAPSITTQPASVSVVAGANVTFTVVASGTAPLSYQWSKNGAAISGATNASYTIASAQSGDAASYTCTVTNSAGFSTTNAATLTVAAAVAAPNIVTQPVSATVAVGGNVSFNVGASGTAPLTYQWYKGGVAIAGATTASYALTAVQPGDAGGYSCVVTNNAGTATSTVATLAVNSPATAPAITTQPANATATTGSSATFSVVASGTAPLNYQWSKSGTVIAGATSATFTITAAQSGDAGSYACTVTNSAGSTTSTLVTLTVTSAVVAPGIATQPASATVTAGASVNFTIVANGTGPLTYQWQKNGTALSGATSATYTIASALPADAGNYLCVVTNSAGSATSNAVTLTVTSAPALPAITAQPSSVTVVVGANASFTLIASGTGPLSYQWYKNSTAIAGATAASYSIGTAQTSDAGAYTCTITNSAGAVTSAAATLTVTSPAPPAATLSAGIINLAVRARLGDSAGTPIIGFVLSGSGAGKRLVVRAVGPTLAATFGLTSAVSDPQLQLWSSSALVASNDNWLASDAAAMAAVGAFPLNSSSGDAAIVTTLAPGNYTTPVSAAGNASGVVLVECYDGAAADISSRLINASARAFVGTGDDVLIPGFVIAGEGSVRMLVRAVGPGLAVFGVPGTLPDPKITLYSGSTAIATNDDWGNAINAAEIAAVATQSGAFALPAGSKDAVILLSLSAGAYTAVVTGAGTSTGTVLVELYLVR